MSDESNANAGRDEWADRLIDRGLREAVGGETPPELSQRIIAAAGSSGAALAATPAASAASLGGLAKGERTWTRWAAFVLAACLLIGVLPALLLPSIQAARESSARNQFRALAERIGTSQSSGGKPANEKETRLEQVKDLRYAGGLRPKGLDEAEADGVLAAVDSLGANALATTDSPRDGEQMGDRAGSASQASRRYARGLQAQTQTSENQGGEDASAENVSGRISDLYAIEGQNGQQQSGNGAAPPYAATATPTAVAPLADYDNLLDLMPAQATPSTPAPNQWAHLSSDARGLQEPARNAPEGADPNVTLMVTPYIIIQEEEERLGILDLDEQLGRGPGAGGDKYLPIVENPFQAVNSATTDNRLSTFSIDVDTASYANVRQFLMKSNMLPPPDAVRIEEMVNYFDYDYSPPTGDVPFASNVEVAACPWAPEHRLVRVGIKGREMDRAKRPKSNLVFLIDVSGSMDEPNKLPLVVEGMRMLTRELGENDRVAIVVYASTEGLVLESTRGDRQQTILDALGRLQAGGSTAGGAGITLAYKIAEQNFIAGGVNRVILCTDGDFNVGVTSPAELQRMAEDKAKGTGVFLTVLGFGRGNLNDAMMEQVADHGNGNYHYVDNRTEARKVLVEEMTGTLVTIAKDVKIQIEFNPAKVAGYRLIGYENRVLAAEDFNDDKKDAGEIGAGHTVTALYEVIPAGQKVEAVTVDDLKYAPVAPGGEAASAAASATDDVDAEPASSDELLTLKIRYKQPDGDESTKLEFPITDNGQAFSAASPDFQFASSVASFGMLLRGSKFKGDATFGGVLEIAEAASRDRDPHGYRREFCDMIRQAKTLAGH